MKFRKINIVTAFAFSAALAFTACSKNDGAIPKRITIDDVPALTINLEPQKKNNQDTMRMSNLAAFSTKFKVALVFPDQAKPTKIDIVVRKNNLPANVRVFKAGLTDYPTATFTVTAADIAALYSAPVALADIYDFGFDIYVGDKKYEAFPSTGVVGNGSGVVGMSSIFFFENVRVITLN